MKMMLPLLLAFLLTSIAYMNCDSPRECHIFNEQCFFFPYVENNPIVNQSTAREICRENDAELPSIHSAGENQFLIDILNMPYKHWLGMVLQFDEPTNPTSSVLTANWTDGTLVDFADPTAPGFEFGSPPWANYSDNTVFGDEPNNFLLMGGSYCTNIKSLTPTNPPSTKAWESQDCGALLRVVCKKPAA